MKALVARDYGRPEDLEVVEMPVPTPRTGQILVRITAASVNATDLRVVTGFYREALELTFPYVPGNDFAGTVVEVGDDVRAFAVGDEIFGQAMHRQLRVVAAPERPSLSTGTLAEYAVFEADTPMLAHRPATLSPGDAAALAIGGMAARSVMKIAEIKSGERVLVIGATGGVGTAVIPLLKATGAVVIATAGTPEGVTVLRNLGADEVIGFEAEQYPEEVDAVLNLVLFADQLGSAGQALRAGGRLVSTVVPAPTPVDLGRDDVEVHFVMDLEGRLGGMPDVAEAAASGLLRATIGATYSLVEGAAAMADFARSVTPGKILVTP